MSSPLILHTEASMGRGGQEARIFTEMEYMRMRGYRCALAAPRNSYIFQRCTEAGFECWPINFTKQSQFFDFFRLYSLLKRYKPLMIGTHSSVDSWVGLCAAKAAGIKAKIRYRHVSVPVKGNFINKYIYNIPDAIVTTGDCITSNLQSFLNLPANKIHTIATGINPPKQMPEPADARRMLQAQLGLPLEARFIGMIAVLRSWKGHTYLLNAFDRVAARWPHYHLVLVGDGPMAETLKKQTAELTYHNRIHFVGHQTDVYKYFRAFDIALLTSTKHEGIPQSMLQAMFARTPVIGTDIGGIPEIVHHEKTGLVIPACNEKAIIDAIENVLMDPRAALKRIEEAYKMVNENHTIEAMGNKIEAVLNKIVKEVIV